MAAKKYIPKVEQKLFTIKLSYIEKQNRFYIDFWDIDPDTHYGKYIASINVNQQEAMAMAKETGVKIIDR